VELPGDEALSVADQARSDADQLASDRDQDAADADQEASDAAQLEADRQQAGSVTSVEDDRAYDLARRRRARRSAQRATNTRTRITAGEARTQHAARRDAIARRRDLEASVRDREADERELAAASRLAALAEAVERDAAVVALREVAAALRDQATADRARAAADRERAAEDRERAAEDRRQARLDLERAHIDELTGVFTRGFGLVEMEHEIARAHRSGEPFTLAFIDVDGLKEINDHDGHAAGDAVLRALGAELQEMLRSYDPVVRMGGDEFVCAFSGTDLAAAATRVAEIRAALSPEVSISVGLAQLQPGEDLEAVTARGDAELYRVKSARR
jgi:diguanylate cyclase (GGDEF)-like protein